MQSVFFILPNRLVMFIEQPRISYRLLYAGTIWRIPQKEKKTVYLTFDDGPIPEVTPWTLDLLGKYDIKATFFCVGENNPRHAQFYPTRANNVSSAIEPLPLPLSKCDDIIFYRTAIIIME